MHETNVSLDGRLAAAGLAPVDAAELDLVEGGGWFGAIVGAVYGPVRGLGAIAGAVVGSKIEDAIKKHL